MAEAHHRQSVALRDIEAADSILKEIRQKWPTNREGRVERRAYIRQMEEFRSSAVKTLEKAMTDISHRKKVFKEREVTFKYFV